MAPAARLALCGAALLGGARGAQAPAQDATKLALLTVSSPTHLSGYYIGRFAPGAVPPAGHAAREALGLVSTSGDACGGYPEDVPAGGFVAIAGTGNCSVKAKAAKANEAGARGMIVVSPTNKTASLWAPGEAFGGAGLYVIGMPNVTGSGLLEHCQAGGCQDVRLRVEEYKPLGLFNDISQLLIVVLATSLIVAGAFFATADLRLGSPFAPQAQEVVEVDTWFPLMFCVTGSGMLVILFFLMRYLIYAIIFLFCIGGTSTMAELGHKCLRYRFPALQRRLCTLPLAGPVEITSLIAVPVAVCVTSAWLVWRNTTYGWFFQDIIGAAFLCFIQRTLRLPNMKLATLLLSLMFLFDIFWVFLSPLLFQRSVMVVVATGGGTGESVPMLLRIPAIGDPLGRDRMLGFGDVALPGLLVSFLRRHDIRSGRSGWSGYFLPSVVGYFVAMCVTLVALYLMQMGQPALLYLVPGTLGTTLVIAYCRGELSDVWEGRPCTNGADSRPCATQLCNYCPGGHPLTPSAAEAGRCDGCQKCVEVGEQVMDCRACNWYLCRACRPVERQPEAVTTEGVDLQAVRPPAEDLERSLVTTST